MANSFQTCDSLQRLPERNLVILGETGVGKSSFINNASLIIRFETLNEAISNAASFSPPIPVQGMFKGIVISEGSDSNERKEKAGSRTLMPQVYRIQNGSCVFHIIDTPGISDSGGFEMDKNHVDNITACLRNFKEIHSILIVVNSSSNTMTNSFRCTLNQLLSCLSKSAAKLISFIVTRVTHTKEICDASDSINKYVNDLKSNPGFNVESSNMFAFEARSFQYFMALKKGVTEDISLEKQVNRMIYANNRFELLRLFKRIYNCSEPYRVMNTETLILAKQVQPKLTGLLSDLNQLDSRKSNDVDQLKLKLSEWREKQTSIEMAKYEEELKEIKNWSENILDFWGQVTTITASGIASGAATGAGAGVFAGQRSGLGVVNRNSAVFGGLIGGIVGGFLGAMTGITRLYASNSDTYYSEVSTLAKIIRSEVTQIEERTRKKETKYEKFKREQRMLWNLLHDINGYMQECAIVVFDENATKVQENEAFEFRLNGSCSHNNETDHWQNDETKTADIDSKMTASDVSAKCEQLSPEILYGRLYAMTKLENFGKDIAAVLFKCYNLANKQFAVIDIIVECDNYFFKEITSGK